MSTAEQYEQILRKYLGYTESPGGSNCNQFSRRLNRGCQAWCADLLVACADEVHLELPSRSGYTPNMYAGFVSEGRTLRKPEYGAFVFWDFPDDLHRIQHVSFCIEYNWFTRRITTIDGNSSSKGSQSNGGKCLIRTRSASSVVGYGLPYYADSVIWQDIPPIKIEEEETMYLVQPAGSPAVWLSTGTEMRWIRNEDQLSKWVPLAYQQRVFRDADPNQIMATPIVKGSLIPHDPALWPTADQNPAFNPADYVVSPI